MHDELQVFDVLANRLPPAEKASPTLLIDAVYPVEILHLEILDFQ